MRRAILTVAAGVALAVAACEGDDSASGSDGLSRADVQDAGVKYARCMRKHGIDVPDPQPGAGGVRGLRGDQDLRNEPGFEAANDACRKYLNDVFGQISDDQMRELQDARLKFARCMRREGFDVPDPQPGAGIGGGQGGGGLGNLDQDDPRVQKAMEKCSKSLPRVLGAR